MELTVAGLTNRDIAKELGIGTQSVKNYLHKIYIKTGTETRVRLARHYYAANACEDCRRKFNWAEA